MQSSLSKTLAILLLLFLTGCAGTDFARIQDDTLVLGQTTSEQVTTLLGSPYREGVITKNNQQLKTKSYAYSSTTGEGSAKGVIPARSQGFYFFNNKLVGYEFTSSWKEDSTDFDGGKVSQIIKGESSRNDVKAIFGEPTGKYIYPVIPGENEEAINYVYNQTKGSSFNLKFYNKVLIVTFNKQDIVTDVEYTESGQN